MCLMWLWPLPKLWWKCRQIDCYQAKGGRKERRFSGAQTTEVAAESLWRLEEGSKSIWERWERTNELKCNQRAC